MTLADDYLSPSAFWLLLLAFAVGCAVLALVKHAHDKEDRKAEAAPMPEPTHPRCVVWGHTYQPAWLCPVCGDHAPRDTQLFDQEDAS